MGVGAGVGTLGATTVLAASIATPSSGRLAAGATDREFPSLSKIARQRASTELGSLSHRSLISSRSHALGPSSSWGSDVSVIARV